MPQPPLFCPFDVRLAVSDVLRSTPTTPSVKEYRSRSVAVLTPSYGLALSVLGIRPTYKMRNIFELSEQIFLKLSGFMAIAICGSCAKKLQKSWVPILREGVGKKFFNPHISTNFGDRDLKISRLLDMQGRYFRSEFCDFSPKNGAWEDDRRN